MCGVCSCVCARVCLCVCYSFEFRSERVCGACVCVLYVRVCSCTPLCSSSATLHLYSCAPAPLAPPSSALALLWSSTPVLLCRSMFCRFQLSSPGIDRFVSIDWSVSSTQHRGRNMLRQNTSLRDVSVLSSETGRACQHPVCKFN